MEIGEGPRVTKLEGWETVEQGDGFMISVLLSEWIWKGFYMIVTLVEVHIHCKNSIGQRGDG